MLCLQSSVFRILIKLLFAVTAVILFISNVQLAVFSALGVSYAGENWSPTVVVFNVIFASSWEALIAWLEFILLTYYAVMILHASFRKLTPAKQLTVRGGNKKTARRWGPANFCWTHSSSHLEAKGLGFSSSTNPADKESRVVPESPQLDLELVISIFS